MVINLEFFNAFLSDSYLRRVLELTPRKKKRRERERPVRFVRVYFGGSLFGETKQRIEPLAVAPFLGLKEDELLYILEQKAEGAMGRVGVRGKDVLALTEGFYLGVIGELLRKYEERKP